MTFHYVMLNVRSLNRPRYRRSSWPDGHWIGYVPAITIPANEVNGRTQELLGEGVDLHRPQHFVYNRPGGLWTPFWVPTADDIFSEDWGLCEAEG